MKVIIVITGRIASGKGTVGAYLERKYGAYSLSSSDVLHEGLDACRIPTTRKNVQAFSLFLTKTFGDDIVGRGVQKRIDSQSDAVIVLNGIRRKGDILHVRKADFRVALWYIEASQRQRYDWYIARHKDMGDAEMSFEDFVAVDTAEIEEHLDEFISASDIVIGNTGSLEELFTAVDHAYKGFIRE